MLKLVAGFAVALLGTSACASQGSTRQAAPADTPPACTSRLSTNCTVSSTDTAVSIAVRNGARILFEDAGGPARTVDVSEVCWAGEDEVDPDTCVTELSDLPTWFSINADSTPIGGDSWPTYSIAVNETTDSASEPFFPLPARVTFIVGNSSSKVAVEVACCDSPTSTQA